MTLSLDDDLRRVLQVIKDSERGLTIHGITGQLATHYGHIQLSALGRNWRESEVRGMVTRLVRKGYLKREGTEVLRWYTLTSLGEGYMSDEVITP